MFVHKVPKLITLNESSFWMVSWTVQAKWKRANVNLHQVSVFPHGHIILHILRAVHFSVWHLAFPEANLMDLIWFDHGICRVAINIPWELCQEDAGRFPGSQHKTSSKLTQQSVVSRLPFALRKAPGHYPQEKILKMCGFNDFFGDCTYFRVELNWCWYLLRGRLHTLQQIQHEYAWFRVVPHKARTSSSTSQRRTRCRRGCRHARIWWNQLQLLSMALWMQALGDSTVVFHGQAA